jgi:hypothetical protein
LRASRVQSVGPPTAPPPRRSRRSSVAPFPDDLPDHDAFALERTVEARLEEPEWLSVSEQVVPTTPKLTAQQRAMASHVMLPPPPDPAELAPEAGWSVVVPEVASSHYPSPLRNVPAPDELSGAAFGRSSPRWGRGWLIVPLVALAVVGLFAIAALSLGLVGKTGW